MPVCAICGYSSRSLQPHLKYKHNLTVSEHDLPSIRNGEITTSAQQELKELLKI